MGSWELEGSGESFDAKCAQLAQGFALLLWGSLAIEAIFCARFLALYSLHLGLAKRVAMGILSGSFR
jgi:hypothetical protein